MTDHTLPDPFTTQNNTTDDANQLWDNDTGTLNEASRRTLLQLLRGPYISAARHSNLWSRILVDETMLRSRLAELFLTLVVDHEQEVAFVRNVDAPDAPRVVRATNLTHIQTVLLLHLRQRLMQDADQSRAVVDDDETIEQLAVFDRVGGTDPAQFEKHVRAAWNRFKELGILYETTTKGRFEISPVLTVIFGADEIAAIRGEYDRLLHERLPLEQERDQPAEEDMS